MNIMASSSSPSAPAGSLTGTDSDCARMLSSLFRRHASRRRRSTARFLATCKSHPRGSVGTPLKGQMERARTRASCTASSARSSRADPSQRASRDTICLALWRNRCSTSSSTSGRSSGSSAEMAQVLDLADLEDAGAIEMRVVREHLQHFVVALGLDEPEAAHDLLGLGIGPVGHHHLSALAAQDAPFPGPQLLRMQHAAVLPEVRVPAHVLLNHLLDFLRAQRAWDPGAASNDQIFRHGWPPFRLKDERGRGESTGLCDYGPLTLPSPQRGEGRAMRARARRPCLCPSATRGPACRRAPRPAPW